MFSYFSVSEFLEINSVYLFIILIICASTSKKGHVQCPNLENKRCCPTDNQVVISGCRNPKQQSYTCDQWSGVSAEHSQFMNNRLLRFDQTLLKSNFLSFDLTTRSSFYVVRRMFLVSQRNGPPLFRTRARPTEHAQGNLWCIFPHWDDSCYY